MIGIDSQFFGNQSLANDWIALDWNGTDEDGMLPDMLTSPPSPEDRTSSADLETILGNDEK